jgi:hypothetical protein
MTIYCLGNSWIKSDSLPLLLLPDLVILFPKINFQEVDPSESFIPENGSIIIDTVLGISDVTIFNNINSFISHNPVSVHDYDLLLHLILLIKLKKIINVQIIGIPNNISTELAVNKIANILNTL